MDLGDFIGPVLGWMVVAGIGLVALYVVIRLAVTHAIIATGPDLRTPDEAPQEDGEAS